jgi:hypothetical protein
MMIVPINPIYINGMQRPSHKRLEVSIRILLTDLEVIPSMKAHKVTEV